MERRDVICRCATSCAATAVSFGNDTFADAKPRPYGRTQLTNGGGQPLRPAQLTISEKNHVFHHPFAGTPCFRLNLGKPTTENAALKAGNGAADQVSSAVIVAQNPART